MKKDNQAGSTHRDIPNVTLLIVSIHTCSVRDDISWATPGVSIGRNVDNEDRVLA